MMVLHSFIKVDVGAGRVPHNTNSGFRSEGAFDNAFRAHTVAVPKSESRNQQKQINQMCFNHLCLKDLSKCLSNPLC
jgi:hypothetical protein